MSCRPFRLVLPAVLLCWLGAACTTSDQSAEVDRAPTEIRTDADRQAAYNNGVGTGTQPDATPNRVPQVREQAAATGARQRIESVNTNDPNLSTPEERVRRIQGNPNMADTLRRP